MDKTLRQILRAAFRDLKYEISRAPEHQEYDIIESEVEQTAKEIESLPPQQAVSDEEMLDFPGEPKVVVRDRTPPSEAETILRELVEWFDHDEFTNNRVMGEREFTALVRRLESERMELYKRARKWCAANPVKG